MKFIDFFRRDKDNRKNIKLGLSLSGGGARGMAHIGVIRAFEEAGLTFDYVTGTSVGSIVGAAYAAGKTSQEMEEYVLTVTDSDILDNRILKINNNSDNIRKVVEKFLGDITFDQLRIPFACVAVDIATGNEVILDSGSVPLACSASSAVPAVFSPVQFGGKILVDGGLLNNIPADIVRKMGAAVVVSVDLNHNRAEGTTSMKLLDQLSATWRIMTSGTAYKGQINTDVMIEPELRIFRRTSLAGTKGMIEEGYRVGLLAIKDIKAKINSK
jgi:NTE family protein